MIDYVGQIRRIMNASVAETFDQATDSLEALSDAIAALAALVGFGPGVGLWMFGRCAAGMVPSTTVITTDNLGAILPDDIFNNEFYIQVIHNTSAPGTAPEREIRRVTDFAGATQTFTTDAFSANLEPGDLICIMHESIMSIEIVGFGSFTNNSATVPADAGHAALYAWENNDYFNGCLLMPTEGVCRFQPRRIVDFTVAGGIFTLDPNNPFSQAPGAAPIDYIIIREQTEFVPAADGLNNRTPSDVIGSKADTQQFILDATSSIIRYLKALHLTKMIVSGTAQAGSDADTLVDAARVEAAGYWVGQYLYVFQMGLTRPIVASVPGSIEVRPAFSSAIAAGNTYVILTDYNDQVLLGLIFDLLNAIFTLKETGGTVTTTGAEQDVYRNETPMGVFKPKKVQIDFTNQTAGETVVVRVYYRIISGGLLIQKDEMTFAGVQLIPLKNVELEPNRFGIRVTMQRTLGVARDYDWSAYYED